MKVNKMVKAGLLVSFAGALLFLLHACKKDNNQIQNPVPNVPVNITINLDLPEYLDLKNQGFWKYLNGGVRGVVVFHGYDDQFYAYDRNCPYQSTDSCATVSVLYDNVYMECGHFRNDTSTTFISCCGSKFFLESGTLAQGPAQGGLKQYYVSRSGSFLQINN